MYRRQGWWLSEEALQIAVKRREPKNKGERERYSHFLKNYFIFWLHWVFVAAHRLSLVAASRLLIAAASLIEEHWV